MDGRAAGEWMNGWMGGWDELARSGLARLLCCVVGGGIGNNCNGTVNDNWGLDLSVWADGRKGLPWSESGGRAAHMYIHPYTTCPRAHSLTHIIAIAIATPIHAYHNDLAPTARGHRAVEHRHSVPIDYMAGRHLVTSTLPLPLIPGPLRFGFAATPPKMHPPTQHAGNACPHEGYSSASSPSNHAQHP